MRHNFIIFLALRIHQNIFEQYRGYSVITEYLTASSPAWRKHQVEIVSNILIEIRHQIVVVSEVDVGLVVVVVVCVDSKVNI